MRVDSARATIRDVAREAGVSVTTASRALNNKGELSESTRELVLTAAARLRYVPSDVARALVSGRTRTIGVLITDNASSVYAEVLRGIEGAANQSDYGVLFMNSGDVQERALHCIRTLEARHVDGVLFTPVQKGDADLEELRATGRPIVALVRRAAGEVVDSVVADNELSGYIATDHLLRLGHKRIAQLAGRPGASTIQDRFDGYVRALSEHGIPIDYALVRHTDHRIDDGYRGALELLDLSDRPTAVIPATMPQALGLLRAAGTLGLRVPDDLSVVAGDDASFAEFLEVPMTCVRQPAIEIGRRGAELLFSRLSGQEDENVISVVLEPQLIVRRSTAPPRVRA